MTRKLFTITMVVLGIAHALQTTSDCAAQSKKETETETMGKAGFEALKGRWLRPDGGYIIQIRSVEGNGKIDAGYFNPQPINVSRAHATRENGKLKVFIELRDAGYPGSTYTLTYDPNEDVLRGVYFQAAVRQNFDIYFTRMK